MSHIFDLCKENSYFFFGPCWVNRLWSCVVATLIGATVSLPFDMIRLRMHTMMPLPDGRLPYNNALDCFLKIARYECDYHKGSNLASFLAGGTMYWARLFGICYVSMFLLDFYHQNRFVDEHWTPNNFNHLGGINWDPVDPYSLAPYREFIEMKNEGKVFDDKGAWTSHNNQYNMA